MSGDELFRWTWFVVGLIIVSILLYLDVLPYGV